ncbi:hypothetical protein M0R45_005719 [Rubus argutus]|uniref:Uncharacterized protein n=1 Tax=Rubus argutus TaxID=59490 RepID=A0AAW1YND8_RUBAR
MDSLEERVSVFYHENSDESDNNPSDYEFNVDDDDSDAKPQRILYWESQQALLQEILERSSLTGSKLRREVCEITEKVREQQADFCQCRKPNVDACNSCLRHGVVNLLCDQGFKATLCTSKWSESKKIPGGTHEYIEVMVIGSRTKQISYVVELEFRDQFEIVKACNEYRNLVKMLPKTFVGKPDYLNAIVRVVCDAAKQSMKESRIHMGPWRKRRFMLMKWSASVERLASVESSSTPNRYDLQSSLSSKRAYASSYRHFSASPAVVVT